MACQVSILLTILASSLNPHPLLFHIDHTSISGTEHIFANPGPCACSYFSQTLPNLPTFCPLNHSLNVISFTKITLKGSREVSDDTMLFNFIELSSVCSHAPICDH